MKTTSLFVWLHRDACKIYMQDESLPRKTISFCAEILPRGHPAFAMEFLGRSPGYGIVISAFPSVNDSGYVLKLYRSNRSAGCSNTVAGAAQAFHLFPDYPQGHLKRGRTIADSGWEFSTNYASVDG